MRDEAHVVEFPTAAIDPTGGRLVAWASGLAAAHRIGSALCATSFCPQHFRGKPDEAAAAILFGDEIGLTPTQALRSVHVISGTPGLYARTMVALVQSRGHRIWTEKETDSEVIVCGQRRGESKVERSAWTLSRAQKAGYTKNAKYAQTPQDMLYARAAATVCRRVAADALAGLAFTVEELELEEGEATETDTPPKRTAKRAPLTPVPEPSLDEPVVGEPATRPQVEKLNILLKESGITDRPDKLAYLSGQVGRDVASSNDLTKAEASSLIEVMEAERRTDQGDDSACPACGAVPWHAPFECPMAGGDGQETLS